MKKNNFTYLRHKWEMPLIWVSFFVTVGTIVSLYTLLFYKLKDVDFEKIDVLPEDLNELVGYGFLVLIFPAVIYFIKAYMAAKTRANGVMAGEKQFPELYSLYLDLAKKLEMDSVPELHVLNGNGVLNAFALSCNSKNNIVVIHSDLAKILDKDKKTVEFVLAHELAHHKLGHVSFFRNLIGVVPNLTKILGPSATRAQEYSADRVACHLVDAPMALTILSAGVGCYEQVNMEEYGKQCESYRKNFLMRVANWLADHAILTKRYLAIKAFEEKGYTAKDSHGEMF